jgi:arsenate reductase
MKEFNQVANSFRTLAQTYMINRSKPAYKTGNLADATLSNKDLFQAIINHPRLLERPIAISQNSAAVGRPPENVLVLL